MDKEIVVPVEYQLRRIADRIKVEGRSSLQAYQISHQQFVAIQWLEDGPMTVGQLAAAIGLAVSTTSEMVDQLILKGCVRREKDIYDKRKVNILLEQKSFDIINEVITKRQHYLDGLISHLNDDEKERLKWTIAQIYQEIEDDSNE